MQALKEEMQSSPDFAADVQLEFNGEVHPAFKQFVTSDGVLDSVTRFTGNIPHDALMALYGSSSLLLLVLTGYKDAEGFLPGKLFEYIATGLPILGVGPLNGDAASVLNNVQTGVMVADDDVGGMRAALRKAYEQWRNAGGQSGRATGATIYSRHAITGQLADLLQRLTQSP